MITTPRPGHDRPEAIARAIRERGRSTIRPAGDGIVAALGRDGVVADPFRATGDLVELLALRAAQLAASLC